MVRAGAGMTETEQAVKWGARARSNAVRGDRAPTLLAGHDATNRRSQSARVVLLQ